MLHTNAKTRSAQRKPKCSLRVAVQTRKKVRCFAAGARPGQFSRDRIHKNKHSAQKKQPAQLHNPTDTEPSAEGSLPDEKDTEASNASKSLAERLLTNKIGRKFSDLNDTTFQVVQPPPKYDEPVPKLITTLRQVLQHNGPVTIGQIDDETPYIDPKSIHVGIPQPEDINWEAIPPFITSSRDTSLLDLATAHGAVFMGSTSSVGPLLGHLHFAITSFAQINISSLSHWFSHSTRTHTRASVKPSINVLRKRSQHIWGIDNAPSGDPKSNQILIDLGKSLERHLTIEWEDFDRIFVRHYDENGNLLPGNYTEEETQESEAHAFLQNGSILLRSQLDCEDPAVPSDKKVFDLKTRATLPIRLDVLNHKDYLDYRVNTRYGLFNSYEREFYDMGRAAFLKYSFQCRIGGMGGVFVAYHNTQELFGFEYIPIEKMDQVVYGNSNKANFVFRHNLNLLETLAQRITKDMAGTTPTRALHDTIRLTTASYANRVVIFAERFEDVDLDDPVALDAALSSSYSGYIYADWLNEDQARGALQRRGLSTAGQRPHLISRLESSVCTPSVLYQPPTLPEVQDLFKKRLFNIYELKIELSSKSTQQPVAWQVILDDVQDVALSYDLNRVKLSDDRMDSYASLYHNLLHEAALLDAPGKFAAKNQRYIPAETLTALEKEAHIIAAKQRMEYANKEHFKMFREDADGQDEALDVQSSTLTAEQLEAIENGDFESDKDVFYDEALGKLKQQYLSEVVSHVRIGGVDVPVSRQDEAKLAERRTNMQSLISQANSYNEILAIEDPAQRKRAEATLKSQFSRSKRS